MTLFVGLGLLLVGGFLDDVDVRLVNRLGALYWS